MNLFQTKRIHYLSGITLAVFISFHLLNHLISLISPTAHIEWMNTFRVVYRNPLVETFVLLSVALQIITGFKLLFHQSEKTLAKKIQIYSGLYLAIFLLIHVGAVMYGRFIHVDTNFYFAAVGMNTYPYTFLFIPYYFLAVTAISWHIASLHYMRTQSLKSAVVIALVGVAIALLIIIGFTDAFRWREMPTEYQKFIHSPF